MMQDTITIEADTWGRGRGEVLAFTCNNVTTNLLIDADDERALLELLLSRQREREGGDERTVQVPVSLPTRERVAALLYRWDHPRGVIPFEREDKRYRTRYLEKASELLALLSTPTAEPWYERTPRTDEQFVADLLAKDAEPPRIEGMAPGTTFRAQAYAQAYQMWRVVNATTVEHQSGFHHHVSVIDPSTIRDVTPPAGA